MDPLHGNSCRSRMAHGFLQLPGPSFGLFSDGAHPAARVTAKAAEVMPKVGIDIGFPVLNRVGTCSFRKGIP